MSEEFSTKEARMRFSEILGRAEYAKERIRLTRRGKTVAYVVPPEDFERLERLDALADEADIQAALEDFRQGNVVSLAELKKQLDL